MKNWKLITFTLLTAALCTSCSTVTPFDMSVANESQLYGALDKASAVEIMKTKVRVSGEDADARTYAVDEHGFSYQKTTKKTRTEWKKGKSKEIKSTHVSTKNVPWNAITDISAYHRDYDWGFLGDLSRRSA